MLWAGRSGEHPLVLGPLRHRNGKGGRGHTSQARHRQGGREGGEGGVSESLKPSAGPTSAGPPSAGPPKISFFFPSLGGLLVEFWWCFEERDPQMSTIELSGCRVKPRRPQSKIGLETHLQKHRFKNTTKIPREDPQE